MADSTPTPLPAITDTPAFRAAYAAADAELRVRQAKLYLILCLILVPAWGGLDWFVYPRLFGRIMAIRLLSDAVHLPCLLALYTRRGRARADLICRLAPLAPCAAICWMIYATEGVFSPYYAGINLCLVGVTLLIPYTLREAAVICAAVVVGYAAACGLHGPGGPAADGVRTTGTASTLLNNIYFLVGTTVIAMAACHYTYLRRRGEFRLRYELDANNRELADALRRLKETEVQLVQSEKMNALGKLSAGLLHEINNPLNYTAMALQVAVADSAGNEVMLDTLKDIGEGMGRIRNVISDLRSFAYPTAASDTQTFPLDEAVTSALRLTTQETGGITLDRSGVAGVTAVGGSTQVAHVLMNLVVNAAHAVKGKWPGEGGRIEIGCRPTADGRRLLVTVKDNGSGVAPEHMPKLLDPFFTTKGPGQGMGLGLSICHTIVKNHGGQVRVASEVGQWTEVSFDLAVPLSSPLMAADPAGERRAA